MFILYKTVELARPRGFMRNTVHKKLFIGDSLLQLYIRWGFPVTLLLLLKICVLRNTLHCRIARENSMYVGKLNDFVPINIDFSDFLCFFTNRQVSLIVSRDSLSPLKNLLTAGNRFSTSAKIAKEDIFYDFYGGILGSFYYKRICNMWLTCAVFLNRFSLLFSYIAGTDYLESNIRKPYFYIPLPHVHGTYYESDRTLAMSAGFFVETADYQQLLLSDNINSWSMYSAEYSWCMLQTPKVPLSLADLSETEEEFFGRYLTRRIMSKFKELGDLDIIANRGIFSEALHDGRLQNCRYPFTELTKGGWTFRGGLLEYEFILVKFFSCLRLKLGMFSAMVREEAKFFLLFGAFYILKNLLYSEFIAGVIAHILGVGGVNHFFLKNLYIESFFSLVTLGSRFADSLLLFSEKVSLEVLEDDVASYFAENFVEILLYEVSHTWPNLFSGIGCDASFIFYFTLAIEDCMFVKNDIISLSMLFDQPYFSFGSSRSVLCHLYDDFSIFNLHITGLHEQVPLTRFGLPHIEFSDIWSLSYWFEGFDTEPQFNELDMNESFWDSDVNVCNIELELGIFVD